MAFDLIIWKWADGNKVADPKEVYDALVEDNPHPALTRFDMAAFKSSLRGTFGEPNADSDPPFLYEVIDFKNVPANWMTLSISWSKVDAVCPEIIRIANAHGLAAFDPQNGRVY